MRRLALPGALAICLGLALACGGGDSPELSKDNWAESSYLIRQTTDNAERTRALELAATGFAAAEAGESSHWHSTGFNVDTENAVSDGVISKDELLKLEEEMDGVGLPAGVDLQTALAQVQAAEAAHEGTLTGAQKSAASKASSLSNWTQSDLQKAIVEAGGTLDECDTETYEGDTDIDCWATRGEDWVYIELSHYKDREDAKLNEEWDAEDGGAVKRDGKSVLVVEVYSAKDARSIADLVLAKKPRLADLGHPEFHDILKGTNLPTPSCDQGKDEDGPWIRCDFSGKDKHGYAALYQEPGRTPRETEFAGGMSLSVLQGDGSMEIEVIERSISEAWIEALEIGVKNSRIDGAAPSASP